MPKGATPGNRNSTGEIPVGPFQRALIRKVELGYTWSEMAESVYGSRKDTSRLKRAIGLMSQTSMPYKKKPYTTVNTAMRYETADRIATRLGLDKMEMGL